MYLFIFKHNSSFQPNNANNFDSLLVSSAPVEVNGSVMTVVTVVEGRVDIGKLRDGAMEPASENSGRFMSDEGVLPARTEQVVYGLHIQFRCQPAARCPRQWGVAANSPVPTGSGTILFPALTEVPPPGRQNKARHGPCVPVCFNHSIY